MIHRIGQDTLELENTRLSAWAATGGKKEAEGPLGTYFD